MMRLDKYLAHVYGISRSDAKSIIKNKEVTVNDVIITDTGFNVDEEKDLVKYGNAETFFEKESYLILNKPKGYVTSTNDPKYPCVMDLIKEQEYQKLFPVGRLDLDSTGLLLLTNDGELSHYLLSPKHHFSKTYQITTLKELSDEDIKTLEAGIVMDHKKNNPAHIEKLSSLEYLVTISDGKYHEVKRMLEYCFNEVTSLKRISFGPIKLPLDLSEGQYRKLTKEEVKILKEIK